MRNKKLMYGVAAVLMIAAAAIGATVALADANPPVKPAKLFCTLPAKPTPVGLKFQLPRKLYGCWYGRKGGKKVPVTAHYTVTARFGDLLGPVDTATGKPPYAACSISPTKNSVTAIKLPPDPTGQFKGSMLPGWAWGKIILRASYKKYRIVVSKDWVLPKPNITAHFFCGPPPKLTPIPGIPDPITGKTPPPTCVFPADNPPVMNGLVMVVKEVRCTGGTGDCQWEKKGTFIQGSYMAPHRQIRCMADDGPYISLLVFRASYGPSPAADACPPAHFNYWGATMPLSPQWGPGYVAPAVAVANYTLNTYPDAGKVFFPAVKVSGKQNACLGDLKN